MIVINNIKKSISGIIYFFFSSVIFVFILKKFGMFKQTNSILGFKYKMILGNNTIWRAEILVILTILAGLTLIFTLFNDRFFQRKGNFSLKEIGFFHNIKTKPLILVFFLSVIFIASIFYSFDTSKSLMIEKFSFSNVLFIFYISIIISIFNVLIMRPFKYLLSVIDKKIFAYIIYDILIVVSQVISFALFNMCIDSFEIVSAALWGFIYVYIYDTSNYSFYPLWILIFVRYVSIFL